MPNNIDLDITSPYYILSDIYNKKTVTIIIIYNRLNELGKYMTKL
jgi:hypothetical protein